MTKEATLQTINGEPTLRFERRLKHPPEKVWRAVSDPAEMAAWFPAKVEAELRPGAPMRFTFPEEAVVDGTWDGEVLEVDPPRVFMFRWNADVLRFELLPDGDGCLLVFTQTIGGGIVGKLGAGRTAAGWDTCLDELAGRLDGRTVTPRSDLVTPMAHYIEAFGLGDGTVRHLDAGYELHFARDLVWKPVDDVWRLLVEDATPNVGDEPPRRAANGHVPAGRITRVEAPHVLEYEATPEGSVRWEIISDPNLGVRVELTHVTAELRPDALATWHLHLELFFAATQGETDLCWSEERFGQLTERYAARLA
ncbi:SRPBCC family protein [Spirillospora sp. NPDC048911]|uniref:SRPBCC family protein n=1 Tax=Spirillospora sp. NPDC048911 TaxID=3364527 RepID=UPI003718322C